MRLAEIDPINLYETHKTFALELASVLEAQERVWKWTVCRPHFWALQQCHRLLREPSKQSSGALMLRPFTPQNHGAGDGEGPGRRLL